MTHRTVGSSNASATTTVPIVPSAGNAAALQRARVAVYLFGVVCSNTTAGTVLLIASRLAHVPTADSSHRPKLVKATITVSIQYCERTASCGLR